MSKPLKLFRVTLDWQQGDPEQGDYCINTWAKNDDQAIRFVAEEMADSGEVEFDTGKERKEWIADRISEAGPYDAELVASSLLHTVRELMAGPQRAMTTASQQDYDQIKTILTKYGATP